MGSGGSPALGHRAVPASVSSRPVFDRSWGSGGDPCRRATAWGSVGRVVGFGLGRGVPGLGRGERDRAIRTGKLYALPRLHLRPIDVVVYHGSRARPGFAVGFPLRCFQRLSRPDVATRLRRWRDDRSTRGPSTPVLSY